MLFSFTCIVIIAILLVQNTSLKNRISTLENLIKQDITDSLN